VADVSTSLGDLIGDLEAEHGALDALVSGIDAPAWDCVTAAEPWTVRDQIGHLAFFDEAATEAIVDPERFVPKAEALIGAGGDPMEEHLRRGRAVKAPQVLAWWRGARSGFVAAARTLDAGDRVPWYGPPMGALSFVSARLMETWAHGQDVADALGVTRPATARLRHVAHLGVRARPFSYAVRGLDVPSEEVRVELTGPDGDSWAWGSAGAPAEVRGPALDFCLVVTQRRHVDDTSLVLSGSAATEWMGIAQAFAGPPGPGRAPGAARAEASGLG
jgi:uncharacterized protein (TIGR03084 family)